MIVTSRDTFPHFGGELINLCTLAEPDAVALLMPLCARPPCDDRISAAAGGSVRRADVRLLAADAADSGRAAQEGS